MCVCVFPLSEVDRIVFARAPRGAWGPGAPASTIQEIQMPIPIPVLAVRESLLSEEIVEGQRGYISRHDRREVDRMLLDEFVGLLTANVFQKNS